MSYVLVDDPDAPTAIVEVRGPRRSGETKLLDGTLLRPPDSGWTDTLARACGFLPVTLTARPSDTATTTFDRTVELVAGVPTVVWTERPKTQAELDAEEREARSESIRSKALTEADWLRTNIEGAPTGAELALNNDNQRNDAIRQHRNAIQRLARDVRYLILIALDPSLLNDDTVADDA